MAQPVKVIGPPYDELVVDTGHTTVNTTEDAMEIPFTSPAAVKLD